MKQNRLNKIIRPSTGRTVIIPMDHGITAGPMKGLENMEETIKKIKEGGADAIIINKGIVKQNRDVLEGLPYLIHVSGSTSLGVPLRKVLIADVKECVELGAVGVSIQINLGNQYEPEMLADFGRIARECEREGMPLLAMMYVRNEKDGEIVNDKNVASITHAARVAYELGADIVKINYTGSPEEFTRVLDSCKIPVVIAGGSKLSKDEFLTVVKDAISAGARGLSCGRNVFQADDVAGMVQDVVGVVHGSN